MKRLFYNGLVELETVSAEAVQTRLGGGIDPRRWVTSHQLIDEIDYVTEEGKIWFAIKTVNEILRMSGRVGWKEDYKYKVWSLTKAARYHRLTRRQFTDLLEKELRWTYRSQESNRIFPRKEIKHDRYLAVVHKVHHRVSHPQTVVTSRGMEKIAIYLCNKELGL